MELEDTYGVVVSEEQATHIQTVGDAVGFVLEHAPEAPSSGPRLAATSTDARHRRPRGADRTTCRPSCATRR